MGVAAAANQAKLVGEARRLRSYAGLALND